MVMARQCPGGVAAVSAKLRAACGGVAQLGERCVRNAEVGSSILLLSTKSLGNKGLLGPFFLAGCIGSGSWRDRSASRAPISRRHSIQAIAVKKVSDARPKHLWGKP